MKRILILLLTLLMFLTACGKTADTAQYKTDVTVTALSEKMMAKIDNAKDLTLAYEKRNILTNVTFSLGRGQAAALLGENGSGKSTLLCTLAGILHPKSGEVIANGRIAYLPQEIALVEELTLEDNLKFFASLAGCPVPDTLPFDADRLRKMRIQKMSGGMKKLCSIVCTLLTDADIYLFDEPCAALDKAHKEMFLAYTRELVQRGKTVLYVAHDREEYTRFSDTLLTLENGCLHTEAVGEVAHA